MNEEEIIVKTTIAEMDEQEVARLYELLETQEPGTEEYDKTLQLIEKIRKTINESAKIQQVYDTSYDNHCHEKEMQTAEIKQRKFESAVKICEVVLKTAGTMLMSWVVLKSNLKYGSIGTKDAWNMIFKKN